MSLTRVVLSFYYNKVNVRSQSSPAVKEGIEKLNIFLNLAMPEINAGLQPDIDALAAKAGIDSDTAKELIAQIDKKLKGNDPHPKRKKK